MNIFLEKFKYLTLEVDLNRMCIFLSKLDTSEAPSLASHVRRVRVPSNIDQFSDVDQYLDDLFSPVLDGSLDELSDARSLSTSIRGGRSEFFEAPEISQNFDDLKTASKLQRVIKGGGHKSDSKKTDDKTTDDNVNASEISLDEYITGWCNTHYLTCGIATNAMRMCNAFVHNCQSFISVS